MPKIVAIAAMDEGRVIGKNGGLPWRLPEDMKRFAALTTGHTVMMGRKTFESLPPKYRPLPNRKNVVITRKQDYNSGHREIEVWGSPTAFLDTCKAGDVELPSELVWVLGGGEIYAATVSHWDEVQLTLVEGRHDGDAWFPEYESGFRVVEETKGEGCRFLHYVRIGT